jgi:hypothetical protein
MCKDYYTLQFMDPSIDTSPIAPALQVRRGVVCVSRTDSSGLAVLGCVAPHNTVPIRAIGSFAAQELHASNCITV